MRGLSIKQPWAGLIAIGKKTIETRTWANSYRGSLLICASQSVDTAARRDSRMGLMETYVPKFLRATGVAVATAEMVDCRPMRDDDEGAALSDCYDGLYAWVLEGVRFFVEPFPVRGALGLFALPGHLDGSLTNERRPATHRNCRVCGCSEYDACVDGCGFGCAWVPEEMVPLCTACAARTAAGLK